MKITPILRISCLLSIMICKVFAKTVPDELMHKVPYNQVGVVYNVNTGIIGTAFCIASRVIIAAKSNLEGNYENIRYYPGYHKVEPPNPTEGIRLRKIFIYKPRFGVSSYLRGLDPINEFSQKELQRLDDIAIAVMMRVFLWGEHLI